jgi:hypothetical protein
MNAEQEPEPRQSRGTVLVMPPRGPQPAQTARPAAPPGQDHAEPAEEPGYGHGV